MPLLFLLFCQNCVSTELGIHGLTSILTILNQKCTRWKPKDGYQTKINDFNEFLNTHFGSDEDSLSKEANIN